MASAQPTSLSLAHDLPDLVRALRQPDAYPGHPTRVDVDETHISYVFLTGQYAYKIKKPLNLGFLDFTTLEQRRAYCQREVELNRELEPDAYLGVVEVRRDAGCYRVEGTGEVVEYAVKMRQFPPESRMDLLLPRDLVTRSQIRGLAERIAGFHGQAPTSEAITQEGGRRALAANIAENFAQTERYVGDTIDRYAFDDSRAFSLACLDAFDALLASREDAGLVRDCHGDLHSRQVFMSDGIHLMDRIEIAERFRYSDTGQDIAFMAMDLDFHQRADLSRLLVQHYSQITGDADLHRVMSFFKCYRAYVRGKVTSLLSDDPAASAGLREEARQRAARYFSLARRHARRNAPKGIFLMVGPTGVGKSVAAGELAQRWGIRHLMADRIRKELAGIPPLERRSEATGKGIYTPRFSRLTYEELLRRAEASLRHRKPVILDATFLRRQHRKPVYALGQRFDVPVWVLWCRAPEPLTHRRLDARALTPSISDGTWEIYQRQATHLEPVREAPPGQVIEIDTSVDRAEGAASLLQELYRRQLLAA